MAFQRGERLSSRRIPHSDARKIPGRQDSPAVRRKSPQADLGLNRSTLRRMLHRCHQILAGRHIPHLYGFIEAPSRYLPTIVGEGHTGNGISLTFERCEQTASFDSPQLDSLISAAGRKYFSVTRKGMSEDRTVVPFEAMKFSTCSDI